MKALGLYERYKGGVGWGGEGSMVKNEGEMHEDKSEHRHWKDFKIACHWAEHK